MELLRNTNFTNDLLLGISKQQEINISIQVWRINGNSIGRITIRSGQHLTRATICDQEQHYIICIEWACSLWHFFTLIDPQISCCSELPFPYHKVDITSRCIDSSFIIIPNVLKTEMTHTFVLSELTMYTPLQPRFAWIYCPSFSFTGSIFVTGGEETQNTLLVCFVEVYHHGYFEKRFSFYPLSYM